jgi:hypothetical protein
MSTAAGFPDRLTTVVGQPKIIALKFSSGKPTKTGNTMYSLTSGMVAFFPPAVAAEIDSLHLSPGEPFMICHRGGPRWDIERTGGANVSPSTPAPPVAMAEHHHPTQHQPTSAPQLPQMPMNGAGLSSADIMSRCYRQAIDIAANAIVYAQDKGMRLTPEFANIQALAATICINEQGRR